MEDRRRAVVLTSQQLASAQSTVDRKRGYRVCGKDDLLCTDVEQLAQQLCTLVT